MTAPFLDPSLLVAMLAPLVAAGIVDAVTEIGAAEDAALRRAMAANRLLCVSALETEAEGPEGAGNDRWITERIGVVIQIRNAAPDGGQAARASLRAIRAAVFDAVEGVQPDHLWSHLRYQGGTALRLDDDPNLIYRWVEIYQTQTASYLTPRSA